MVGPKYTNIPAVKIEVFSNLGPIIINMKRKTLHIVMPVMAIFCTLIFSGCSNVVYNDDQEAKYIKPTIAVIGFENRAPAKMRGQIGDGMSEQLTEQLIATRRYVVIEREHFQDILNELNNSKNDRFREQGRLQSGQLKLVDYLIRGVITDYGHVETNQGIGRVLDLGLLGPSSYTVVAATITVVDVQSGQTIASVSVEGKAKTTSQKDDMRDDSVAFGGHAFYKTSLGKATKDMLHEAVEAITRMIAEEKFHSKIARVDGRTVYIVGGEDRKLEVGQIYNVRGIPKEIMDPETGDLLGEIPGPYIGKVEIRHVMEKYSIAKILSGERYEQGQVLFNPEDDPSFNPKPKPDPEIPFIKFRNQE